MDGCESVSRRPGTGRDPVFKAQGSWTPVVAEETDHVDFA
jgi:hypothetical protein